MPEIIQKIPQTAKIQTLALDLDETLINQNQKNVPPLTKSDNSSFAFQ